MKKVLLFASCAVLLASCSNNELPDKPNNPGSDIKFSLKLDGSRQSRTLYGDEVNNAFPIYWVNDDRIIVASPQCAEGRNNAIYKVAVSGSTNSTAESVTKVGDTGVQWGENFPFNFYSVYPVSYNTTSTREVKNSIENRTDNAVAHLNVRNYQINLFDLVNGEWKGTPIDRKSMTDLDANQKNPDALMYAQTLQTKNGNVELYYKPFTVAFHVTLDGYTLAGMGTDPTVTIEEVMITAPTGTQLVGNFDATFDANCVETPTVNTSVNTLREPNVIHIPTMSSIDGHYLTISQNQKVSFNVFAIPTEGTVTSDWTLTVRTTAGNYSRPLTPGSGANAGQLIAGQMHKLNMPKFQVTTDFQFNKESWIAQIPRNVYLSELSLPGAWYCYSSDYQATTNLTEQWNAGVRAFHIDCRLTDNRYFRPTSQILTCAGTDKGGTAGVGYSSGTPVLTQLQTINSLLDNNTSEYAIVVLTIAEKPLTSSTIAHGSIDQTKMLNAIAGILNTTNLSHLYTEPISASTTVNDVLGRLIVKVNTTNDGPYTDTVPSTLMSKASLASDAIFNAMQNSDMYWGTEQTDLTFYYMQGQRTYISGSGNPLMTARQKAIDNIIAESESVYQASSHNAWFQMGIGGYVKNSDRDSEDRVTVANRLNEYLLQRVNAKADGTSLNGVAYSPSPVGIVLANFITVNTRNSTQVYGTDLINGIIEMNRMFRLDRDPDQPEWPGQQTQTDTPVNSVSQNHTSGYNVNPDGWAAF